MIQLPYFDAILDACQKNESDVIRTFGQNVHWGYWENPESATGSVDDFVRASDAMTRKVCDAAGIRDGMAVLDAGCGFGGTVANLDSRFSGMKLTGLNIDRRQIERARGEVKARAENTIAFVVGDACELPFADASFDVVLAVECILYFPSRMRFLREASRVLKPGGTLIVSEYVAPVRTYPLMALAGVPNLRTIKRFYGDTIPIPPSWYRAFARRAGFSAPEVVDVSRKVLPTFPFLLSLLPRFPLDPTAQDAAIRATRLIARMSERGWIRYQVLTFRIRGTGGCEKIKTLPRRH